MEKNKYTLLFLCLFPIMLFAKANTNKYIVYFKDKPTSTNILKLFSAKALEKRKQKNIVFDERDYPINTSYIEQIQTKHSNVLSQSNWLNAILIETNDKNISTLKKFNFIKSITKVEKAAGKNGIASTQNTNECESVNNIEDFEDNFASSFAQFNLLNGEYLHEQGYNGENMTIAICDAGFRNADINTGFSAVFSENRILGTYDYVHSDSTVFTSSDDAHGANCFSFIAGFIANQYIGTATKSNFYLFQTENNDNGSERLQEEFNLATALERCSQLGVDVVSISLGYTTFDVASENHDTSDMMKNITPAAIAVNIASSKGILVCAAAGNEGAGAWHYISTPSDADSAFCIASVDINGNPSSFSGYGLANDSRVKPNVAAVGQSTNFINTSGTVSSGNGTSYACPSLAGMATCLWQAFPTKTNWEIKTAIEQSASKYLTPDKRVGYGIPDFKRAYELLSLASSITNNQLENEFNVFPNPFQNVIQINNNGISTIQQVQIFNNLGNTVLSQNVPTSNIISINDLPKGLYVLQLSTNKGTLTKKILKN